MINDCNIKNLAKNPVSAGFHSRAFRRSVTQIYGALYGDTMLGTKIFSVSFSFSFADSLYLSMPICVTNITHTPSVKYRAIKLNLSRDKYEFIAR